jgi:subtilisin family serine protease
MIRKTGYATLVGSAVFAVFAGSALAQQASTVRVAALSEPATAVRPTFQSDRTGKVTVAVRLTDAPLATALGPNAKFGTARMTPEQSRAYLATLQQKQAVVASQITSLGGTELARLTRASNAVVASVPDSAVAALASIAGVTSVETVVDFEKSLSNTVPGIGARAVQNQGVRGAGVKVAVLDSGIDYTHIAFGGPGTIPGYQAAYGLAPDDPKNTRRDGLFPTAKVAEGFDFVGESWPSGPLIPDPDPIDLEGHGTHVADIIAGAQGVAPDAKLYAVKVCSAVSSSCSGVAILQGFEYVLDPNGDGDLSDALDVANLSLGASYGQRENPSSFAAAVVSRFGVTVVVSAGNSADRPFITGSPSATPEVISVAQTTMPNAIGFPLVVNAPASVAGQYRNTATVDWAPIDAGFTNAELVYAGRACPGDPLLANPAGKVALVDRGVCGVSLKVDVAGAAGAIGVIVANNVSGDAPSFSFAGGTNMRPTLIVTQATGAALRPLASASPSTVRVTVSPSSAVSLALGIEGTSSRGPGYSYAHLKPDIGAPGRSVSAIAGSGTGTEGFGGTSGAAPMVAGSAALLLSAQPNLTPTEVKSRLITTANPDVVTNPLTAPGILAPLSRIGGGEVRVDRALASRTGAWDAGDPLSVSLSFGAPRVTGTTTLRKRVVVRNYAPVARTYAIAPSFRFASDQAANAVTITAPPSVTVPANGTGIVTVTMSINAANLPGWQASQINGGANGGTGALLQGVEFDGFLTLTGGGDTVRLPWHVIPRRSANVVASASGGTLSLTNATPTAGTTEVFQLTGTSPQLPGPRPGYGEGFTITDLRAMGVRTVNAGATPVVQFAVNTFGRRSHPAYPAFIEVYLDTNRDGTDDWVIFTQENGAFASSGTVVTFIRPVTSSTGGGFFFTDADLLSGNAILTVPRSITTGAAAGFSLANGQSFDFRVEVGDNYFTGDTTDVSGKMTYTVGSPRFDFGGGLAGATGFDVPAAFTGAVPVVSTGSTAPSTVSGLLLMYRDAANSEADAVTITP